MDFYKELLRDKSYSEDILNEYDYEKYAFHN